MVSRNTIFLAIAASGSMEEAGLKQFLTITDERQFQQDLQFLITDKFIEKQGSKLAYTKNPNSEILLDVLKFAVTYDINFDNYFSSPMLMFLEQTYNQKYFDFKEVQQNEEMKKHNISILRKNGFVIILNPNPFLGKVIQNSFLDAILKMNRRSPAPTDKKKKDINVESFLVGKLMKKTLQLKMGVKDDPTSKPEITYLETDNPTAGFYVSPTREQRAIKQRISAINKETFNVEFMENLRRTETVMVQNVKSRIRLSKGVIMDYHQRLMNDPKIGGIIRQENVQVVGNPYFKTADFRKIEGLLDNFIKRYQKTQLKNMPEVVKFGAWIHNELQFIHPFIDGNSRLTRLVMDHYFRENSAPIYEIPVAYISRYSALTKGARNRDDNKLFELFKEIFLYIICKLPG